jgi:uncharacterized membrane protein YciS (DUF1049 family)
MISHIILIFHVVIKLSVIEFDDNENVCYMVKQSSFRRDAIMEILFGAGVHESWAPGHPDILYSCT